MNIKLIFKTIGLIFILISSFFAVANTENPKSDAADITDVERKYELVKNDEVSPSGNVDKYHKVQSSELVSEVTTKKRTKEKRFPKYDPGKSLSKKYGNSPLHIAFFNKDTDEIKRLLKKGENNEHKNDSGLVPSQMWQFGDVLKIISSTVNQLNNSGRWKSKRKANELYEELLDNEPDFIVSAIIHKVLNDSATRTKSIVLAVKLGIPDSEVKLNRILKKYGNKSMAEDFLNSGSEILAEGGRSWAQAHGLTVTRGKRSHRSTWGRF